MRLAGLCLCLDTRDSGTAAAQGHSALIPHVRGFWLSSSDQKVVLALSGFISAWYNAAICRALAHFHFVVRAPWPPRFPVQVLGNFSLHFL